MPCWTHRVKYLSSAPNSHGRTAIQILGLARYGSWPGLRDLPNQSARGIPRSRHPRVGGRAMLNPAIAVLSVAGVMAAALSVVPQKRRLQRLATSSFAVPLLKRQIRGRASGFIRLQLRRWRESTSLAGNQRGLSRLVIEMTILSFPEVRAATRSLARWLDERNELLGATKVEIPNFDLGRVGCAACVTHATRRANPVEVRKTRKPIRYERQFSKEEDNPSVIVGCWGPIRPLDVVVAGLVSWIGVRANGR